MAVRQEAPGKSVHYRAQVKNEDKLLTFDTRMQNAFSSHSVSAHHFKDGNRKRIGS